MVLVRNIGWKYWVWIIFSFCLGAGLPWVILACTWSLRESEDRTAAYVPVRFGFWSMLLAGGSCCIVFKAKIIFLITLLSEMVRCFIAHARFSIARLVYCCGRDSGTIRGSHEESPTSTLADIRGTHQRRSYAAVVGLNHRMISGVDRRKTKREDKEEGKGPG